MSTPDVSIIIACWNAAAHSERAVASALEAEGLAVEVIAVDDASTDNTWQVLRRLAAIDSRVIVDRLPTNGGPSAARNRAITRARGRFIAILDADDALMPDRLSRLVALAESRRADIAVDNMQDVDATGARLGPAPFLRSARFQRAGNIDLQTWVAFNQPLKPGDCLGYLKPLIRREALDRLQASYDPALRNSEDYYLIANLLAAGARMTYTPEPGYLYTRAAGSTSHRLKPEHTQAWLGAERAFQQRHAATLPAGLQKALATRLRALRNVNHFVAAVEALKTRRIFAFMRLLVSDIRATAFTLRTFGEIAFAKLTGRKPSTYEPAA
jgi:succinoglycan biosynthesis protein ExoO